MPTTLHPRLNVIGKNDFPDIPYSLLIFHPDFTMNDLPITPIESVIRAYKISKEYLTRVHVGNIHLIGFHRYEDFERYASTFKS